MAHFGYTLLPNGQWANGMVPTGSQVSDWESKMFRAVNGDEGGSWAPSSAIVVGGQGMQIPNGCTWRAMFGGTLRMESGSAARWDTGAAADMLTGAVLFVRAGAALSSNGVVTIDGGGGGQNGTLNAVNGASVNLDTTSKLKAPGASVVITDGGHIALAANRTRIIVQPLVLSYMDAGWIVTAAGGHLLTTDAALGHVAELPLVNLHDRATLASITITRRGVNHPGGAPSGPAALDVLRLDNQTGDRQSLLPTTTALPTPPVNTFLRSIVSTSQFNVIDTSRYSYYVRYWEEFGANAVSGTAWFPPQCNFTGIADLGWA